jgi:exodeoxyribonuclease VII large subunit
MLEAFFDKESRQVLTVAELTERVKLLLEERFPDIWVRGEISNFRRAASGHIYFTLKDEKAVVKAVLFRGSQNQLRFEPGDGLKVVLHGNLDVFDKRGEYQIIVDFMEPEGIGSLQLAFEQLKEKLKKEGLFDEARKRPIPAFPEAVGVVTSPSGAALRDILNIVDRRYRGIRMIIYPTLVQGQGAAEEIAAAIRKANERAEVDVLIVGRGGGSLEDLWPFNEEIVARAIHASIIPVISAVGHEVDFTISDFTADMRAPTPSAAAELVVKNKEELLRWFRELVERLSTSVKRHVERNKERISLYTYDVLLRRLKTLINEKSLILDDLAKSMGSGMDAVLARGKGRFEILVGQLNALSPLNTLARGFAIVLKLPEMSPLFSISGLRRGDGVKTKLRDGEFTSVVETVEKTPERTE